MSVGLELDEVRENIAREKAMEYIGTHPDEFGEDDGFGWPFSPSG